MYLLQLLGLFILLLAWGCGGGPPTTTQPTPIGYEFQRLCSTLGNHQGRISRDQFLAKAKDKQAANQLFDACDLNRDNFVSEQEAAQAPYSFQNLKAQVLLFQTPRP